VLQPGPHLFAQHARSVVFNTFFCMYQPSSSRKRSNRPASVVAVVCCDRRIGK
jgi:hypothetical protein